MSSSQYSQNLVFNGLGTLSIVPNDFAGPMEVNVQSTIPTLVNGGGVSALQIIIKQNASTIYTGVAGASGAQALIPAIAVGDTISIVFQSSAAADQGLNVIKSAISLSSGIGV